MGDREAKNLAKSAISKWAAQDNLSESLDSQDNSIYEDTINLSAHSNVTTADFPTNFPDNPEGDETDTLIGEGDVDYQQLLSDLEVADHTIDIEGVETESKPESLEWDFYENNLLETVRTLDTNQTNMAEGPSVTEILKDIPTFSGKLSDINKFVSMCKAGLTFLDPAKETDIRRYINGIKNKLDGTTFNVVAATTFESVDSFIEAIEKIFLISNDPSTIQIDIIQRLQKQDESIMTFANKLLEKQNQYIMLYKNKCPTENVETIKHSSELMLTHSFLRNLKQPFRKYAKGHFFATFDEAKKWALDVEKLEEPRLENDQQFGSSGFNKMGSKFNQGQKQNFGQRSDNNNFRGGNFNRQGFQNRNTVQHFQPRGNFQGNFQPQFFPQPQNYGQSSTQQAQQPRYNGTNSPQMNYNQNGSSSSQSYNSAPQNFNAQNKQPPNRQNAFMLSNKERKNERMRFFANKSDSEENHQSHNLDYPHLYTFNDSKN